jgi:hypothetical protein
MNWITFLSALGGCYALYYGLLIAMDAMKGPGAKKHAGPPQMVIDAEYVPEKISLEDFPVDSGSPAIGASIASVGLGGVSLKEVFELSRAKALEYTRPVSF